MPSEPERTSRGAGFSGNVVNCQIGCESTTQLDQRAGQDIIAETMGRIPKRQGARKLLFPAMRWLDRERGPLDAHADILELVLRDFVLRANENPDGPIAYVAALKKKHPGIDANFSPPEHVRSNAARWSLVQTHVIAREFFKKFARDYRRFKKPQQWRSKRGNETLDPLDVIAENISRDISRDIEKNINYRIVTYYRSVRNEMIHLDAPSAISQWQDILRRRPEFEKEFPGMDLPGEPANISHQDCRIYTRAISRLANELNDRCELTPEEIAAAWIDDESFVAQCLRYRSTRKTLAKHLRRCFDKEFGNAAAGFEKISGLMWQHMESIPNRAARERGRRPRL